MRNVQVESSSDWKVPSWSIQQPSNGHGNSLVNEALAAPLPVGQNVSSGTQALQPDGSDGIPSIDGDAGMLHSL